MIAEASDSARRSPNTSTPAVPLYPITAAVVISHLGEFAMSRYAHHVIVPTAAMVIDQATPVGRSQSQPSLVNSATKAAPTKTRPIALNT